MSAVKVWKENFSFPKYIIQFKSVPFQDESWVHAKYRDCLQLHLSSENRNSSILKIYERK